ncbi:uncharacterized protein LOC143550163 [Bidens hawaiensis]|uniref:uncharacterized protein LOC143550163 n=1 Tax=Bidens hawaiensis TaxID=980011 RepID=UPI00404B2C8C
MDPHSFIARAEAQRWLGIAEKLLISHDLVGSKTFAIRARESDPRLEAAEQILAIADTLLAAEKRVVGNNGAHQPDFYAILQLVRFAQDTEHIASQYRRLAVLLNPHQNRFPYADQAFQLVNDAGAVLSNPMRKSMYDSDLDYPQQQMTSLGFNLEQQQQHHQQQHQQQQQPQQQQPHNFFSINQELPEQQPSFQPRIHQSHQQQQLQQHNFLSQPNPVRPLPVREQEHMFQHREPEHLLPFQVTSPPHQPNRPSPQPHIQSPPQSPFSWQGGQQSQSQFQHHRIKQEQQHQHEQQLQQQLKQEQLRQQQQQEQLKQLKQQQFQQQQKHMMEEQRKQQQLQEEQRKQQQLLEEQRKQQQLQEEQRKQQQLLEEQRKQQHLQEEQRKQQQLLEEQRKQQQLLEEQRKQQQLQEEQQKQQQLLEEQRKQQQLLEEQRKQQLLEEQRKQQQLLEEQQRQQQLQEEQRKQQQLQEEQRKQQEQQKQDSLNQNAAPVQNNTNNGVREEETETELEPEPEPDDNSPTFWTACPYCFYMYEYPKLYVECTLRCENCKRAFQAVRISSPPPIIEGQDAYFYCWGFFPIGLSMSHLQDNKGTRSSNWTPFSSLHTTSNNQQNHLNEQAAPKQNPFVNKSSGPRINIDDITDDVFTGVSEPSSDSDIEWNSVKKQKLKKMDKGFKERIQVLALRAMYNTDNGSVNNLKDGVEVPAVLVVETNKKHVGSNPRKQSKLDLNVAAGTRVREQGEEDNVGGIAFFDGLDEYLSNLPILSVVSEDKVTVA